MAIALFVSIVVLYCAWTRATNERRNELTTPIPAARKRKTVLITDCPAGSTGAALAHAFRKHGYTVFATARDVSQTLQSLRDSENVHLLHLDVADQASIDRVVAVVRDVVQENGLDVLVNTAGVMLSVLGLGVDTDTDADADEAGGACFEATFRKTLCTTQAFSPLLAIASECGKNRGEGAATIVNLGNIIRETRFADHQTQCGSCHTTAAYAASKAARHALPESMRLELAPLDVRLLTVVVGAVESDLMREQTWFCAKSGFVEGLVDQYGEEVVEGVVSRQDMAAEEFAEWVVREVEAGGKGEGDRACG